MILHRLVLFAAVIASAIPADQDCNQPADVVLLLDDSASVWARDFKTMLGFVKSLVNKFDVSQSHTRVAAAVFSRGTREEFPFGKYNTKSEVVAALDLIKQRQGDRTETNLGIDYAKNTFSASSRAGVPHTLIIITDGTSFDREKTKQAAADAIKANITILVIGVGNMDKTQLAEMASKPLSEHLFTVDSFPDLSSIGTLVAQQTCPDTGPAPTDMPADAPIKVCSQKPADVVFVIDKSTSVYILDFQKQLEFVNKVIDLFDIGVGKTRVAAVSFSTNASIEYNLDEYDNKADIKARTSKIKYTAGNTATWAALEMVRNQVFTPAHGFRPNVANIVIVITDGQSQKPAQTKAEAKILKDDGVHMIAIGVGNKTDPVELTDIGSTPSSQYVFEVNGYNALDTIKNILAFTACDQKP